MSNTKSAEGQLSGRGTEEVWYSAIACTQRISPWEPLEKSVFAPFSYYPLVVKFRSSLVLTGK